VGIGERDAASGDRGVVKGSLAGCAHAREPAVAAKRHFGNVPSATQACLRMARHVSSFPASSLAGAREAAAEGRAAAHGGRRVAYAAAGAARLLSAPLVSSRSKMRNRRGTCDKYGEIIRRERGAGNGPRLNRAYSRRP
jgi:hypothetical protein